LQCGEFTLKPGNPFFNGCQLRAAIVRVCAARWFRYVPVCHGHHFRASFAPIHGKIRQILFSLAGGRHIESGEWRSGALLDTLSGQP
jgi:hypothetical protein